MKIKNVIFHNPATIVIWDDNTKTVVKVNKDDAFDAETGLAMAITKKYVNSAHWKQKYCRTHVGAQKIGNEWIENEMHYEKED